MALLLSAVRLVPAQNLVDVPLDGLQLLEPLFLFVIGVIPVSYTHLDVYKRQVCALFGGGGHARAAGCTIEGSIEFVKAKLLPV